MLSPSLVLSSKESTCNAGYNRDSGSVCGSERSTGEGNGDLFQILAGEFLGQRSLTDYSLWGREELNTTEQLSLSPLDCKTMS